MPCSSGWIENTISAQRAAKSCPRAEDPAWMMTGRPCGERGMLRGPRLLKIPALVVHEGGCAQGSA